MVYFLTNFQDWAQQLEQQIDGDTQPQDLTTVNVAMQRQQMIESEMMKKVQHLESLQEMEPKLEEMHPENVKFIIFLKYVFLIYIVLAGRH